MNMDTIAAAAFALLLPSVCVAQDPGKRAVTGVRRALLIGIDDYAHVTKLRGCANDVRLMAHVLESRFGFTDVTMLLDGRATRAGIVTALRRAVDRTEKGDALFVHYSGHGSYVEDFPVGNALRGDEEDGYDETLVPQDGRGGVDERGEPVLDVVDDEIDEILSRLRTDNVWIYLDACHSRTGTRDIGGDVLEREVSPDPRTDLYRSKVVSRSVEPQQFDRPHVLLTSAAEQEKALDGPVDGRYHGLFTRALATVLGRQSFLATAEETWREAGEEYCRIVDSLGVSRRASTPMLQVGHTAWAKQPFLPPPASNTGARLPWLVARGSSRTVRLLEGNLRAVPIGSEWSLFPAGEVEFDPDDAVAWGAVRGFDGDDAILELSHRRSGARRVDGSRAAQIAPPMDAGEVVVKVRATGDARGRLEAALRRAAPRLRIVGDDPGQAARFRIVHDGDRYAIHGGDGQAPLGAANDAAEVSGLLTRALTTARLLAIDNPTTRMRVRIWTDRNADLGAVPGETGDRDIAVLRATGARSSVYHVWREGDDPDDHNCLLLNVAAEQDCYLTVVNVDSEGDVNLLFPNRWSEEAGYHPQGFVAAMAPVRLPDRIAPDNRAGFNLALRSVGQETVRVFATADSTTAAVIRDAVATIDALQRDDDRDDPDAEVERILQDLRAALLGRSRGIEPVPTRRQGFVPRPSTGRPSTGPEVADGDGIAAVEPAATSDWTASTLTIVVGPRN